MTNQLTSCPYCKADTRFEMPENYAPVYVHCTSCKKKFIIERLKEGFAAMTIEEAPSCSDPDRRAIEMGGGQEE